MNKTCLIDLDGTMYCGDTLIEGAKRFIDWMLEHQHPFLFLTNNATRTRAENVAHMEKLGYRGIKPSHFFTSAMASAAYVAKQSHKRRAYVIGMAGAALMLSKIVMPYLDVSEHVASALNEGNVASALVVLARSLLIIGFLTCIMAWGK